MSNFTVDTFVIDGMPIKISPDLSAILDIIYPVGCVICRVDSENPGTLFGFGVWQQLSIGKYIRTGDAETNGGSNSVNLSVDNLPPHTHSVEENGEHGHTVTLTESGEHNHDVTIGNSGSHTHAGEISESGEHSHRASAKITQNKLQAGTQTFQWRTDGETASTNLVSIDNNGRHTHEITLSNGGTHTHNANSDKAGKHTHTANCGTSGKHTHTATETGRGVSVKIEPEYISLAFWKRIE